MPTESGSTGETVVQLLRDGRFREIREMFAPSLRPMVTAEGIEAAWTAEVRQHGPVASVGTPAVEPSGTGMERMERILVTFEHGAATLIVSGTPTGLLTGLQVAPASAAEPVVPWEPPDYADPAAFEERDVTVGSGSLAVPGALTLPRRPGPWPAVVLLAGSGPHDRDETLGRNKPFKDLAWGLASRDIAVLRFDKVTYAHAGQVVAHRGFTLSDEYVPHAVAAVRMLAGQPGVDPGRIFVAGHSLGGTVAPRVAAAEPSVAGLVILAGGVQPMHWAAVRQFRYIAALDPAKAAAAQPAIDALTKQATVVDSADLGPSTPDSELPFGAPAAYWLDLRDYDPPAAAAALGKPILVVQGGRDYQVTVADDLTGWRAALADRPDVTIHVHDADNHLFFPGTGPSRPAEYEPAQHVDPAVVDDVADWLTVAG